MHSNRAYSFTKNMNKQSDELWPEFEMSVIPGDNHFLPRKNSSFVKKALEFKEAINIFVISHSST